ncbi:MAG TPA: FeoB-associated Cys-rich membrane protein [Phycisphaerae bacterium]|nr:FeoB-associated Cys-rich membrane protein [Phycisphaerae bacterium]
MGFMDTLIVVIIVVAAAVLAGRRLWRTARGRRPCGGCAGACDHRQNP